MDYMFACNLAFELDAFDSNGEPLAYCATAEQQDLLEQIYQHGCYTDDLLLLWGEDGVGKTVLAQALANKIQAQAIAVYIDVSLEMEADDFRQAYQQACEQHGEAEDIRNGAQHWLLIDHAEQLQPSALEYIAETLILLPAVAVCLFARAGAQEALQAGFVELGQQDFYLSALAESELEEYLQTRLLAAGISAHELEIEASDLAKIYKASKGLPRLINQQAKKTLAASFAGGEESESKASGLPVASYMVAGLGVILLTIGGLWFLYQGESSAELNTRQDLAIKPLEIKALDEGSKQSGKEASDTAKQASEQLSQRLQQAVQQVEPSELAKSKVSEAAPAAKAQKAAPESNVQAVEPDAVVEPAPAVTTTNKSKVAAEQKRPVVQSKPKSKPAVTRFSNAEAVLMALEAKHYVLQVAGARNLDSLSRFRDALPRQYQGLIYQRQLKGKPWYVLVLGDFDDPKSAKAEIAKLPKTIQNQRPWAKSVASVQAEIKAGG